MSRPSPNAKWIYLWAPVFFYMAFIFFLSSFSFPYPWFQKEQKMHGDCVAHVVEYTVFGIFLSRALGHYGLFWRAKARLFVVGAILGVLYGALDEYHQSFVPGRDSSVLDLAADAVGITLGAWIWLKKQMGVSNA